MIAVQSDGKENNYQLDISVEPVISESINVSSDANAAEFDALTGINNPSEIPSGADFNTTGLDTPTVSLIEYFSGSDALDSGGLASNPVSSPSGNLLAADSLAGEANSSEIFSDNSLSIF